MNSNTTERSPHLRERLDSLPTKPGVYLMKDGEGRIIYVGKASNLRSRVRSYFYASAEHTPRTQRLADDIHDLEFIITDSEVEALILENTLIKRHQPRYNVRLKDDKRYPYVKILSKPRVEGELDITLSQAAERVLGILEKMIQLAEFEARVERIADELGKTNRKVNALENTIIPSYKRVIKFIEDKLDEESLEELVRMKLIGGALARRRA